MFFKVLFLNILYNDEKKPYFATKIANIDRKTTLKKTIILNWLKNELLAIFL